jgi:hypothetical protein
MRAGAIAANRNIRGHSIMASLLLPLPSIVNELPAGCVLVQIRGLRKMGWDLFCPIKILRLEKTRSDASKIYFKQQD